MVDFKIESLSFSYPLSRKKALNNVNLEIKSGEFILICGESGSGKTTLLRLMKPELAPNGAVNGKITFFGVPGKSFSRRQSSSMVGFVAQDPYFQAVTNTVGSEIAFGLENLGKSAEEIRLSTAETASYFGLDNIFHKNIADLSGGKLQLVCLASVMAMHPKVLLLDEPFAQLDPMAAQTLLDTIVRLCRDEGITVVLTEHRLQNILPVVDRVIVMKDGCIVSDCCPRQIDAKLIKNNKFIACSVPGAMKIHYALSLGGETPLTVGEGRRMLESLFPNEISSFPLKKQELNYDETAIEMKNVYHAYDKSGYILKGLSLKIPKGKIYAIMGANSAGKTTAIKLMSGILPVKRGKVELFGKCIDKYSDAILHGVLTAVVPQKTQTLFAGPTVREDILSVFASLKIDRKQINERLKKVTDLCCLDDILDAHPYDISGGQMQRAALAMALIKQPKILFLDEPTKGMDELFKLELASILLSLAKNGVTVVLVSHDTEFCARCADNCAMIFDGVCAAQSDKHTFFSSNHFFTTQASKISRGIFQQAVTDEEVISLCKKRMQN